MLRISVVIFVSVLELISCQSNINDEGIFTEEYHSKAMYTITLSIDPTRIQVIADPRLSNEFHPIYELVYVSGQPSSQIRRIPHLMKKLRMPEIWQSHTDIVADHTTIISPNKVGILPVNTVQNQPPYIWWVASGYHDTRSVFASNVGGIFLINMSAEKWRPIAIANRTGIGFSHVEWIDMNIDNYVDCVTIEGSNRMNSLVWLQQPPDQSQWIRHLISGAQDVGGAEFRVMHLPSAVTETTMNVFIVAGRKSGKLTAYWVEDPNNDWTREKKVRSQVIATDGFYVGLEIVDLNMDGRPDILTSTTATARARGMVLAYEYPKGGFDSKGGKWRMHILSQWNMAATSYGMTSPGPVQSFNMHSSLPGRSQQKPHILVSGQDDGKVYVLSPDAWSSFIWSYKRREIWSSSKRVGMPTIADIDGNGDMEIFIPADYSINVLKYAHGNSSTTVGLSPAALISNILLVVIKAVSSFLER